MKKSIAILLMFLIWTLIAMCTLSDACEVSRHRLNDTRYVIHDMDCDGVADRVFEYRWNGKQFIFLGSYPYSVRN